MRGDRAFKLDVVRGVLVERFGCERDAESSSPRVDLWYRLGTESWWQGRLFFRSVPGEPEHVLEQALLGFCRQMRIEGQEVLARVVAKGGEYLGPT